MNTTDNIPYIWLPCKDGYFTPGRKGFKSIILHSTEGSKQGDIATLTGQTDRKVSVNWYLLRDGTTYHFVVDSDTAYHAGAVISPKYSNAYSLGIEQEHRQGQDWPDVQVRACARLCAALMQKHGVMEITTHAHAAAPPGRKSDPAGYPMPQFLAYLSEAKGTHFGFAVQK